MPLFGRRSDEVAVKKPDAEMSKEEETTAEEYEKLPVQGIRGWADCVYVFFFFFFSGVACTGCLLFFTLSDATELELSHDVKAHCGGFGDRWKIDQGAVKEIEDHQGFYEHCYREYALEKVSNHFLSVIEVYLLSILLFVCLVVEMKEYISPSGWSAFNNMTIVYYVSECLIFFWYFFSTVSTLLLVDDGSAVLENNKLTSQLANNGTNNTFITLIFVVRCLVIMAVTAILYLYKVKNSTEYKPQSKRTKSCNKSCFFCGLIGLSSLLAVFVLIAYLEDVSLPGKFILTEQCGQDTLDLYNKKCDEDAAGKCAGYEGGPELSDAMCKRCGEPKITDESFAFFSADQKDCIDYMLRTPQEETVASYIIAYSASYIFFLMLLHSERDRFQTIRAWYGYRIIFSLMVLIEVFIFLGFANGVGSEDEKPITLANPRPYTLHIASMFAGVACVRTLGLIAIFTLEQFEVGFSYCTRCCHCAGWQGAGSVVAVTPVSPATPTGAVEMNGEKIVYKDTQAESAYNSADMNV